MPFCAASADFTSSRRKAVPTRVHGSNGLPCWTRRVRRRMLSSGARISTISPWVSRGHGADSFTKLQAAATRALELDSESAITHMLLSWVHLLRGNHDAAIADAERAVALAPGAAATLTTLAVMLNMAGRPEEGLAASDRALRLSPIPRSSDLRARAVALRLLGRYAEAIALYEACRRAEPHSTLALIGLTIAHVFADDMEGARATAREILTRDPTFSVDGFAGLLYRDPAQIEREKQALRRAGLR